MYPLLSYFVKLQNVLNGNPNSIYLFIFDNGNTGIICEIRSKLTIKTVTLNRLRLLLCFYYRLSISRSQLTNYVSSQSLAKYLMWSHFFEWTISSSVIEKSFRIQRLSIFTRFYRAPFNRHRIVLKIIHEISHDPS